MNMSQEIINELTFFLYSLALGICVTFLYDWFLIFRRIIPHHIIWESMEDLLYWIVCAILMFYLLYQQNSGILRWFAIAGAASGMIVYKKLVGLFFVQIMSTFFLKIIQAVTAFLKIIIKPLKCVNSVVFKGIRQKLRQLCKYMKKRLTIGIKMLKITLCKR